MNIISKSWQQWQLKFLRVQEKNTLSESSDCHEAEQIRKKHVTKIYQLLLVQYFNPTMFTSNCQVYDILIDARLWNGEWSKAAALLKDVVEMGFPVDVVKHRRLLQDLKDFYGGSDGALGILAEVVPEETRPSLEEEMDPDQQRQRQWLAKVPTSDATVQGRKVSATLIL